MAFKTTVWGNTTDDGKWGTAANWSNGQPVNGADKYEIVFDPNETQTPPTLELDQTGTTVDNIVFLQGWDFGIGTLANPMKIKVDSQAVPAGTSNLFNGITVHGSGAFHIAPQNGTDVVIDTGGSERVFLSGNLRYLHVENGEVSVASGLAWSGTVFVYGGRLELLTVGALNISQVGGTVDVRADFTLGSKLNISAGICNVREVAFTDFLILGGRVNMLNKPSAGSSNYHVLAGTLDFSGSSHKPSMQGDLFIGPAAKVIWGSIPDSIGGPDGDAIDLREVNP